MKFECMVSLKLSFETDDIRSGNDAEKCTKEFLEHLTQEQETANPIISDWQYIEKPKRCPQ